MRIWTHPLERVEKRTYFRPTLDQNHAFCAKRHRKKTSKPMACPNWGAPPWSHRLPGSELQNRRCRWHSARCSKPHLANRWLRPGSVGPCKSPGLIPFWIPRTSNIKSWAYWRHGLKMPPVSPSCLSKSYQKKGANNGPMMSDVSWGLVPRHPGAMRISDQCDSGYSSMWISWVKLW